MQEFSYSITMGPCHFCDAMPCPPHPHWCVELHGETQQTKLKAVKHVSVGFPFFHWDTIDSLTPWCSTTESVMAQNEQKNRRFANRSEQENWCTDRQWCYDASVSQGKHLRMNVLGGWRQGLSKCILLYTNTRQHRQRAAVYNRVTYHKESRNPASVAQGSACNCRTRPVLCARTVAPSTLCPASSMTSDLCPPSTLYHAKRQPILSTVFYTPLLLSSCSRVLLL
jgi:hypothetical protein